MSTGQKETEWTGLSMKQADALRNLRIERHKKGDIQFQLPADPLALVRFYWSEIEKKPCPEHLLEGVPGYEPGPRCEPAAKALAEELGLDLRVIMPSGPNASVTEQDVLNHIETKFARFTAKGRKSGYKPGPVTDMSDILGPKE